MAAVGRHRFVFSPSAPVSGEYRRRLCSASFGRCSFGIVTHGGGITEAAIAEHAHRFLEWLLARPEPVVAVATHCNFLLAMYHGVLDGAPESAQVFHTGELRALRISAVAHEPRVRQYAMFSARREAPKVETVAVEDSPCCVHSLDVGNARERAGGAQDAPTSTVLPLGCDLEVVIQPTPRERERMYL